MSVTKEMEEKFKQLEKIRLSISRLLANFHYLKSLPDMKDSWQELQEWKKKAGHIVKDKSISSAIKRYENVIIPENLENVEKEDCHIQQDIWQEIN